MSTTIIGHTVKPGHKCRNPFGSQIKAANIKAGERIEFKGWELYANWSSNGNYYYYHVEKAKQASDVYEFSNINCAAAKLLELSGAAK